MNSADDKHSTIFLIEEDDDTRTVLRQNLKRAGYRVHLAVDKEDAIDRVTVKQVHPDLLLMDTVDKSPEETLAIGREIRERGEFSDDTPIIVLAEKYGNDLEGQDVNVGGNDWITYPEDATQLHNLIKRLSTKSTV